jgi:hypothetical protein
MLVATLGQFHDGAHVVLDDKQRDAKVCIAML